MTDALDFINGCFGSGPQHLCFVFDGGYKTRKHGALGTLEYVDVMVGNKCVHALSAQPGQLAFRPIGVS